MDSQVAREADGCAWGFDVGPVFVGDGYAAFAGGGCAGGGFCFAERVSGRGGECGGEFGSAWGARRNVWGDWRGRGWAGFAEVFAGGKHC